MEPKSVSFINGLLYLNVILDIFFAWRCFFGHTGVWLLVNTGPDVRMILVLVCCLLACIHLHAAIDIYESNAYRSALISHVLVFVYFLAYGMRVKGLSFVDTLTGLAHTKEPLLLITSGAFFLLMTGQYYTYALGRGLADKVKKAQ
eukprot:jgi/Mesvir1/14301/Mv09725-RA.1